MIMVTMALVLAAAVPVLVPGSLVVLVFVLLVLTAHAAVSGMVRLGGPVLL
ncbi:hypothetical protein ACFQY5_38135 [Paeniroseomonas aquatica]|uniref:Uncharacterized protein n=1 Tax=Paeniroseomonas aquatica TaxID=373043 RepID=A0ABT8A375_9PROT|nr:hypothetical protein [Paeniroseomonas aquatica]MDN3564123.1 hypothetical protein [Paeniroseomonas aquatica]